jgi:hypothetical protein
MNRLRRLTFLAGSTLAVALGAAGAALAQPGAAAPPPPLPAGLEPVPEAGGDPDLEPQVTITRRQTETIEEARIAGRLVWIKVTPLHGKPYFLIPDANGYAFIRRDSLDTGLKVPLWELLTF